MAVECNAVKIEAKIERGYLTHNKMGMKSPAVSPDIMLYIFWVTVTLSAIQLMMKWMVVVLVLGGW